MEATTVWREIMACKVCIGDTLVFDSPYGERRYRVTRTQRHGGNIEIMGDGIGEGTPPMGFWDGPRTATLRIVGY